MKINRNFVQITSTAIVTSTIFIVYILLSNRSEPAFSFVHSDRITWVQAQTLKNEYLGFKPLRVKHKGQSGTDPDKVEDLEGFVYDAGQLNEIINDNHSPLKNPDKVIFYFGQDGKFGGLTKYGHMHIIAIGLKGDELLTTGTPFTVDKTQASIFDKADPCPPFCPTK